MALVCTPSFLVYRRKSPCVANNGRESQGYGCMRNIAAVFRIARSSRYSGCGESNRQYAFSHRPSVRSGAASVDGANRWKGSPTCRCITFSNGKLFGRYSGICVRQTERLNGSIISRLFLSLSGNTGYSTAFACFFRSSLFPPSYCVPCGAIQGFRK